jgi:hypothetical protein
MSVIYESQGQLNNGDLSRSKDNSTNISIAKQNAEQFNQGANQLKEVAVNFFERQAKIENEKFKTELAIETNNMIKNIYKQAPANTQKFNELADKEMNKFLSKLPSDEYKNIAKSSFNSVKGSYFDRVENQELTNRDQSAKFIGSSYIESAKDNMRFLLKAKIKGRATAEMEKEYNTIKANQMNILTRKGSRGQNLFTIEEQENHILHYEENLLMGAAHDIIKDSFDNYANDPEQWEETKKQLNIYNADNIENTALAFLSKDNKDRLQNTINDYQNMLDKHDEKIKSINKSNLDEETKQLKAMQEEKYLIGQANFQDKYANSILLLEEEFKKENANIKDVMQTTDKKQQAKTLEKLTPNFIRENIQETVGKIAEINNNLDLSFANGDIKEAFYRKTKEDINKWTSNAVDSIELNNLYFNNAKKPELITTINEAFNSIDNQTSKFNNLERKELKQEILINLTNHRIALNSIDENVKKEVSKIVEYFIDDKYKIPHDNPHRQLLINEVIYRKEEEQRKKIMDDIAKERYNELYDEDNEDINN